MMSKTFLIIAITLFIGSLVLMLKSIAVGLKKDDTNYIVQRLDAYIIGIVLAGILAIAGIFLQ